MSDSMEDVLKNWTEQEKFYLYITSKSSAEIDMKKIQECIPTRKPEELKAAIDYFKAAPAPHLYDEKQEHQPQREMRGTFGEQYIPLSGNLELLAAVSSEDKVVSANSIRMFADSNVPPPEFTGGIDFRNVYHQLANGIEGKLMVADSLTVAVLRKFVQDTIKRGGGYISPEFAEFIKRLDMLGQSDEEHEVLKHLSGSPD